MMKIILIDVNRLVTMDVIGEETYSGAEDEAVSLWFEFQKNSDLSLLRFMMKHYFSAVHCHGSLRTVRNIMRPHAHASLNCKPSYKGGKCVEAENRYMLGN